MKERSNTKENIYKSLYNLFSFKPTSDQEKFLKLFSKFLFEKKKDHALLLKGYAGTGKTSLLCCIIAYLKQIKHKYILLAPTGKAAKVISSYTKNKAFTVHKEIYSVEEKKSGDIKFIRKENKRSDTLFFIDESSMISDDSAADDLFKKDSLLGDLLDYIKEGKNCSVVFIGDTAQLPPVKMDECPALEENNLSNFYNRTTDSITLKQVTRQHKNSGILHNATILRNTLDKNIFNFRFDFRFPDVTLLREPQAIESALRNCLENVSDTIVILRSNKRALLYNKQIRSKIMKFSSDIHIGDRLMNVKNNYFWVERGSSVGFIANGDTFGILKIIKKEEKYGFSFAQVKVQLLDHPDESPLITYLILDSLECAGPNLSFEETNRLYQNISQTYSGSKYAKMTKTKSNVYYNALQVKYAYALTCHKSQGGQWNNIFVEKPYLPNGENKEHYKWLYTAVTRAKKKLYLIRF